MPTLKRAPRFSPISIVTYAAIFGIVCSLFVWKSEAAGAPVPVPAATSNGILVGNGFVEASARQVVRTSANKVYVMTADDDPCLTTTSPTKGVIHVWKGTGAQASNANVPTGFSEMDAANHPVAAGTGGSCQFSGGVTNMLLSPDIRLDASGIIHLAYIDGNNGNVYYQTFSTITDTWGSRVIIGSGALTDSGSGWPRGGQLALTLDSSDIPRVVYATSGTSNSIEYTDKTSGSWSAPITVGSGTDLAHPSMVTSVNGNLHLAWLANSHAAHSAISYSQNTGSGWSAVENVSSGDSVVLGNGDDDQGPSITVDSSNRPHVLFNDGTVNGTDNYVRLRYRTAANTWVDDSPPGTSGGAPSASGTWYNHTPQNYISSAGDEFVFLGHDVNISPGIYEYQTGGVGNNWSAAQQLDPRNKTNTTAGAAGLDGSASIRWDPLRDNNTGIIDMLYYDENDGTAGYSHHATVYYKAIDISSMLNDSTPPTVSMSAPAAGTTVNGSSVIVSATASDNVGVAGVQFQLDGVNLGTEDTTSPYSISWDSSTATNASHILTAIARDAAGNTTTSSPITITVSNTCPGGDVNGDCHVTITDLSILLSSWGSTTNATCDLNSNGIVDIFDLSILLSHYGS